MLAEDDPGDAYQSLLVQRREESRVDGKCLQIVGRKVRKKISKAKLPMLAAIIKIVYDQKDYWPLSDRSIHYDMLTNPVLRHASKPDSWYRNDGYSYDDLTDMLTRARLTGLIPFDSIEDPTRTVRTWNVHAHVGPFVNESLEYFLRGCARNLQQSQPNHIEIVGEKNTLKGSIRPVAMEYCIPYTLGRGYCSLDPRKKMLDRYKASGKNKLVILMMTDFDPEGDDIPNTYAKSMRDDFGCDKLVVKQVCLTYDQVIERDLPQTLQLKKKGARCPGFVAKYPDHPYAHELEAIPVAERQELLTEVIAEVLDIDLYNAEVKAEQADAAKLEALRKAVRPALTEALRSIVA